MPSSAPQAPGVAPLQGLRVVCFESRRTAESSRLIARHGGNPIEAPALREVPLRGPLGLDELEARLRAREPVSLILLTGVGTELLLEGLSHGPERSLALELLQAPNVKLVCRGPKPHAALKHAGIRPEVVVGEPNTWRDVLAELDARDLVRGRRVFVQEYGRSNQDLLVALQQRAPLGLAQVKTYAWELPEELGPLRSAIERIANGEADAALFTSGIQVTHLLQVARELGAVERLRSGLSRLVVASVGPLTSEALRAAEIEPDIEPEHPKLGHLMLALSAEGPRKLAQKRAEPG